MSHADRLQTEDALEQHLNTWFSILPLAQYDVLTW